MGDRHGAALFLGSVLFYAVQWQAGIVIVDTYAVANALAALGEGRLAIETARFGPGLETPGMHLVDGRYYARNYGQIVAALPLYWAIEAVDAVAELRVAVVAAWSLCLLALARVLAAIRDDRRLLTGGAVAAVAVFLVNLRAPTPVPDGTTPVLALQVLSMGCAALCGVFTYRLVGEFRERRVALLAGGAVALATPVAFWAPIPKRHTLSTAVVLAVAYLLHRSRNADRADPWATTTLRAGMYALVGLFAWVHAPLALTLALPLVVADPPTAPANDARSLAVVGGALLLALVPFFLTNYLIAGNPVIPPRLLPAADAAASAGGAAESLSAAGPGRGGSRASADLLVSASVGGVLLAQAGPVASTAVSVASTAGSVVSTAASLVERVVGTYWHGAVVAVTEPRTLYHVFLVSAGSVPGVTPDSVEQASNYAMLEAAPLFGAALAVPVLVVGSVLGSARGGAVGRGTDGRLADRVPSLAAARSAVTPTDAVLVGFSVLVALIYLPRLPLFGQITVRYLTPLYPVAVYTVCRHHGLARRLAADWRAGAYAFEATVLLGCPLAVAAVLWFGLAEPAAFDAIAAVNALGGAAVFAVALAGATRTAAGRLFAGVAGLAAGLGTAFVVLAQLLFFHYGIHLLPVVQVITEFVRLILVRGTV